MKRIFERIRTRRKETARRLRKAKRQELDNRFDVADKDGSIWITFDGVAIRRIDRYEPMEGVIGDLNEMRNYAAMYAGLMEK